MTSWCDKLASVPSAGFRYDHSYLPREIILDSLRPILDANATDVGAEFQVPRNDDFNVEISLESGFRYGVDPNRVHVSFNHHMKVRNVSGAAPKVEMISKPQPFTALLPDVISRLISISFLLPGVDKRRLLRIGTTATTPVDAADLPPGLGRFLTYVGKPWDGLKGGFSIQVTGEIQNSESFTDRCLHTFLRSEKEDEVMTVQLDFQRTFKEPKVANRDALNSLCDELQRDSLDYFERLAEGNMFE